MTWASRFPSRSWRSRSGSGLGVCCPKAVPTLPGLTTLTVIQSLASSSRAVRDAVLSADLVEAYLAMNGMCFVDACELMSARAAGTSRRPRVQECTQRSAQCSIVRCMPYVDAGGQTAAFSRVIGQRVRASRTGLGWTLDELADRSGVSRRMLINVEHGVTNASIGTLLRLSDALGIGLPALVDTADDGAQDVVIHRAGVVAPMWTSPTGGSAVMVAGTAPPDVSELWDWRLGPGDNHRSEAHRTGTRELMYVLAGAVLLVVGDVEHRLRQGDSASFDGTVPHAYRNASASRPARFSLAVYEPALSKDLS